MQRLFPRPRISGFRRIFQGLRVLLCLATGVVFFASPFSSRDASAGNLESSEVSKLPELHNYSEETVVLYNSRVSESRDLAVFYAKSRGIPDANLVGLDCSEEQTISRGEFRSNIEMPLRAAFEKNDWWTTEGEGGEVTSQNKHVFAIMYGMPLRVMDQDLAYRQNTSTASVDSELMQFGSGNTGLEGFVKNPYFGRDESFHEAGLPGFFLVGRIDGSTAEVSRRLITHAIEIEKTGLWGFAFVDLSQMYPEGDQWMNNIAATNRNFGIPTIVDEDKALFPANYPAKDPALYYGWYSRKFTGMPARGNFRFCKGAVACHIYSFSATNLRKPQSGWASKLLELGAATVLGNVSEPYLALTTHLDKFNAALLQGRTVAEACHSATPGLSWMTILCGDPLYRPFAAHRAIPAGSAPKQTDGNADYKLFYSATQAWLKDDPRVLAEKLNLAGTNLRSSTILESLGLLAQSAGDTASAEAAFAKALKFAENETDQTRIRLHGVTLLGESDPENKETIVKALRSILAGARDEHIRNGIQGYLNRLNAPPPPPPKQPGRTTPGKGSDQTGGKRELLKP